MPYKILSSKFSIKNSTRMNETYNPCGYPSRSHVTFLNSNQSINFNIHQKKGKIREQKNEEMHRQTQRVKSRVVKVDSEESWDFFINQASNQGCPVMVHFTAAWCVPSVAMNPFFEELALRYQDILFLVVDVDDVKGVASKMEIKAMPTFVLMRQGTQIDKLVGANPDEIRKRVDGFAHQIRSYKSK